MALQLSAAKVNGQSAVLAMTGTRDVIDPLQLCRFLKQHFPEEYRAVHYEIVVANGTQFELPESVDANP